MKSCMVTVILAASIFLPAVGLANSHARAELDHSATSASPIQASNKRPLKHEQVVAIRGEVITIDTRARLITLKTEDGATFDVQAGDKVKNFDEFSVGDLIKATYIESVVFQIVPKDETQGTPPQDGSLTGHTKLGGKVTTSFEVASVDPTTNTLWVTLADGTKKPISFDEGSHKRLMTIVPGSVLLATYTASAAGRLDKLVGTSGQ